MEYGSGVETCSMEACMVATGQSILVFGIGFGLICCNHNSCRRDSRKGGQWGNKFQN